MSTISQSVNFTKEKVTIDFFVNETKKKYEVSDLEDQKMYSISDLGFYVNTPDGISLVSHCIRKNLSLATIHLDDSSLECAQTHLLKTEEGFIQVKDLTANDKIFSLNGYVNIKDINLSSERKDFYDIAVVNDSHTFFTSDGILHHNTREDANRRRHSSKTWSIRWKRLY